MRHLSNTHNVDQLWPVKAEPLADFEIIHMAYDTGVGALEGEEGIANLVRAFLFAGAESVVATFGLQATPAPLLRRDHRQQQRLVLYFPTADSKLAYQLPRPSISNRQL